MKSLIIITAFLLVLTGCAANTLILEKNFDMKQDDTVSFEDIQFKLVSITFAPCPDKVICVWSGLGVDIQATQGEDEKNFLLELDSAEEIYGYKLRLVKLTPDTATLNLKE